MQMLRPSDERGHANFGWLDSRHSFSFGNYHDPKHIQFGALRVINEDHVAAGAGFDTHGHQEMEIISYVLEGAMEHKDSIGTGSVIRPGDLQRMSAGTGIRHSEYNHSQTDPVHFFQIWIVPEVMGLAPGYEQRAFSEAERSDQLRLMGSRDGREGSLTIHQDVDLFGSLLSTQASTSFEIRPGRKIWIQLARGRLSIDGTPIRPGDGLGLTDSGHITITAQEDAEFLLFDLAA